MEAEAAESNRILHAEAEKERARLDQIRMENDVRELETQTLLEKEQLLREMMNSEVKKRVNEEKRRLAEDMAAAEHDRLQDEERRQLEVKSRVEREKLRIADEIKNRVELEEQQMKAKQDWMAEEVKRRVAEQKKELDASSEAMISIETERCSHQLQLGEKLSQTAMTNVQQRQQELHKDSTMVPPLPQSLSDGLSG